MIKSEARKLFKQQRLQLPRKDKNRFDDLLLIEFQRASLPFIHSLLSYWPIEEYNEPNTHLFTDYIEYMNPKLHICYPRITPGTSHMDAIYTPEGASFMRNEYNIAEPKEGTITDPQELDMVFVPLLVFDTSGFRAGYGKGFYDRFLEKCRPDCLKVGFSYFEPVDHLEDVDEFDIPLNLCITPHKTYVF